MLVQPHRGFSQALLPKKNYGFDYHARWKTCSGLRSRLLHVIRQLKSHELRVRYGIPHDATRSLNRRHSQLGDSLVSCHEGRFYVHFSVLDLHLVGPVELYR